METRERLKKFGFNNPEEFEVGSFFTPQMKTTGYPSPHNSHLLVIETQNPTIESYYHWLMNHARYDFAYVTIDKITDIFAASENSSLFGVSQQRLGIQQDRVSQYLATIGKFMKELFQMVRELRIIDERLVYYEDSWKHPKENASEITLKGLWIDQVEGGAKNPASIYGMSRELQFTTLPDLFFSAPPMKNNEVEDYVNSLDFNTSVKNVLKRKLKTFIVWKEKTYAELKTRKNFQIKYMRQHFDIIRMYMNWIKPYLRYVRKLQSKEEFLDSPEIVSSFEGSLAEIEILLRKKPEGNNKVWACLMMTFEYKSKPQMSYHAEGYQRGPMHSGEVKIYFRTYSWTSEEIENYKKMREEEDLDLIASIDASLKAAMDELGDDFKKYLAERGEIFKEDEPQKKGEEPKKENVLSPFVGIVKGFGELFGYKPGRKSTVGKPKKEEDLSGERAKAKGELIVQEYIIYKNFKKANGMIAWR